MKICMLVEQWFPQVGGVENHVRFLTKNLTKAGHEVHIVVRNLRLKGMTPQKIEKEFMKSVTITRLGPASIFENDVGRVLYAALSSLKVIKDESFDIIHAHSFTATIPALLGKHVLKIPTILTMHTSHFRKWYSITKRVLRSEIYSAIERKTLFNNRFDRIITVNKSLIETAMKLGVSKDKLTYIPNAIELEEFDSYNLDVNASSQEKTVLFVGRLTPVKGLHILLRAISLVLDKSKHYKFLIVGEGPLKDDLTKYIYKKNLQEHVYLLGVQTGQDLIRLYKTSNVVVLSSYAEGCPVSVLEAWGAGLPVVATSAGGTKEIVEHRKNGLLVPAGDPKALAKGLIKILTDEELARLLGANGRALVEKEYNWKIMVKKILAVYQDSLRA
ncbi:MAG: glycosyltransferase family 4 protein [Promethearchaeota archaeon]